MNIVECVSVVNSMKKLTEEMNQLRNGLRSMTILPVIFNKLEEKTDQMSRVLSAVSREISSANPEDIEGILKNHGFDYELLKRKEKNTNE